MSIYTRTGNPRGRNKLKYDKPLVRTNMVLRVDQMEFLLARAIFQDTNIQVVVREMVDAYIDWMKECPLPD